MNAIAQRENGTAITERVDAPVNMMEVISRAAADPNTDVDKLERLMAMAERIKAKEAEQAFNTAMVDAQKDIKRVAPDLENPQTRSKYASLAALDRVLRPVYTKHGFALSFDTGDGAPAEHIRVICHVLHNAGHSRDYRVDMPCDGKGAKGNDVMTKTHAAGSAFSYGARYLEKMIFNVAIGQDDDDGNAAGGNGPITDEQFATINEMMEKADADPEKFAKYMGVDALKEIPASKYGRALEALNLAIDKRQRDKGKQKPGAAAS